MAWFESVILVYKGLLLVVLSFLDDGVGQAGVNLMISGNLCATGRCHGVVCDVGLNTQRSTLRVFTSSLRSARITSVLCLFGSFLVVCAVHTAVLLVALVQRSKGSSSICPTSWSL